VNPAHLQLGSQGENVSDMDAKGRRKSRNLRGPAHGMSKWTEDQVRAVKRATGPYKEIAEKTGVSYGSVKQIKRGNVWRHIE
jgi:transcriptional regulator with XRE-family HTH domain